MSQDHAVDQAFAHAASAGAIVGTFLGYLPTVAGVVALIWYLIQIWESKTVQGWVQRRRARRHHH